MKIFALLLSLATVIAACGGGGSEYNNNDKIDLSGTWRIELELTDNTCASDGTDENPTSTVTVVQIGNSITVIDEENENTNCTLNNDRDGFSCNQQDSILDCSADTAVTFNNASDGLADVRITSNLNCPNVNPCQLTYTGTATRL